MTLATADGAPPRLPGLRWREPWFLGAMVAIPITTLLTMLLWQGDARAAFRIVQLCFGWAVVVQLLFVVRHAFERGWLELFAYVLHLVAVGAASLTVTFRVEQYPQDLFYDQMALLGLAGQLTIGFMVLASAPLRPLARLDARVLTICAAIVCTAALIKFGFYLQYTGLRSGGHMDIYTDGDAVRDNSPAAVRILAAGAPLIGLLAITQPGLPRWCRVLGVLAIALEFAIGIRSRPLFLLLSALALVQYRLPLTPARKMAIAGGAVAGVIAIAAIGYFRENNSVGAVDYFWIVLESLFGVFEAGVFAAQVPDTAPIIAWQIWPLLVPTPLTSVDTVSKILSSTFSPYAYQLGFWYSSAALTEVNMLLGPVASAVAYPVAILGILTLIRSSVTSPRPTFFLYGACVLPIAFYIWRAELWQLVVPAIKALPFIALLLGVNAYARLTRPRPAAAALPRRETPGREMTER